MLDVHRSPGRTMTAERQRKTYTSEVVRGGAWALSGRIAAAIAGIIATGLLTRLTSAGDAGRYFFIMALVGLGATVGGLGSGTAVTALAGNAVVADPKSVHRTVRKAGRVALGGGTVAGLAIATVGLAELSVQSINTGMRDTWLIAGGLVLLFAARKVAAESLRSMGDIRGATIWLDVAPSVGLAVAFLVVWYLGIVVDVNLLLSVTALTWIAVLIGSRLALRHTLRPFRSDGRAPPLSRYVSIGLPLVGTALLSVAVSQAGTVALGAVNSAEEVAVLGGGLRLAAWVVAPLTIVTAVLPPYIVRLWASKEGSNLTRLLRGSATVSFAPALALTLLFAVAGRQVLAALFGEFYAAAYLPLVILSIGHLANTASGSATLVLSLVGLQSVPLRVSLVTAPLTVAGMILLGGPFGATGIAVCASVGMAAQGWLTALAAHRRARVASWMTVSLSDAADIARLLGSSLGRIRATNRRAIRENRD